MRSSRAICKVARFVAGSTFGAERLQSEVFKGLAHFKRGGFARFRAGLEVNRVARERFVNFAGIGARVLVESRRVLHIRLISILFLT